MIILQLPINDNESKINFALLIYLNPVQKLLNLFLILYRTSVADMFCNDVVYILTAIIPWLELELWENTHWFVVWWWWLDITCLGRIGWEIRFWDGLVWRSFLYVLFFGLVDEGELWIVCFSLVVYLVLLTLWRHLYKLYVFEI